MADDLRFARLGRPHGVRGEILVHPYNEGASCDDLSFPLQVTIVAAGVRRSINWLRARPAAKAWIANFAQILDRDAAMTLTNAELWVARSALPPLDDDQVFVGDLIGCQAQSVQGLALGTVKGTFWNGAHDILSIIDDAGAERLIPAVPEFLIEVDLAAARIVVDPHE